jgi:hypothetical protein
VFQGHRKLTHRGYHVDHAGVPTFAYEMETGNGQTLALTERPAPLSSAAGTGLARHFTLEVPGGWTPWLHAGSGERPRLLDSKGNSLPLDLTGTRAEAPAADRVVVLPQGGGHVTLLAVAAAPVGTRWQLRQLNGSWQALLRLPANPGHAQVDLKVWSPYRDEPELLRSLATTK